MIEHARRASRLMVIAAVCAAAGAGSAVAQERPYAPSMTCAALKATVDRLHDVVVATGAHTYEAVHRDGGACTDDTAAAPAFEPSLDVPQCFAGYRCRQRDSDGNSGP